MCVTSGQLNARWQPSRPHPLFWGIIFLEIPAPPIINSCQCVGGMTTVGRHVRMDTRPNHTAEAKCRAGDERERKCSQHPSSPPHLRCCICCVHEILNAPRWWKFLRSRPLLVKLSGKISFTTARIHVRDNVPMHERVHLGMRACC